MARPTHYASRVPAGGIGTWEAPCNYKRDLRTFWDKGRNRFTDDPREVTCAKCLAAIADETAPDRQEAKSALTPKYGLNPTRVGCRIEVPVAAEDTASDTPREYSNARFAVAAYVRHRDETDAIRTNEMDPNMPRIESDRPVPDRAMRHGEQFADVQAALGHALDQPMLCAGSSLTVQQRLTVIVWDVAGELVYENPEARVPRTKANVSLEHAGEVRKKTWLPRRVGVGRQWISRRIAEWQGRDESEVSEQDVKWFVDAMMRVVRERLEPGGRVPRGTGQEDAMAVTKPWDLEGWDAIGKAIGKDARTAQRYAARAEDPLPVKRPRHTTEVVAVEAELTAWFARQVDESAA